MLTNWQVDDLGGNALYLCTSTYLLTYENLHSLKALMNTSSMNDGTYTVNISNITDANRGMLSKM